MIIDVNVEIINKIAGNALGGLSYRTAFGGPFEGFNQ